MNRKSRSSASASWRNRSISGAGSSRRGCTKLADIDLDQHGFPQICLINAPVTGNIVFRCPRTGLNVQHWLADEVAPDDPQRALEAVTCKACTRIHFINRSNGKLLGEGG